MTLHQGQIAQGQVTPWSVPGLRRAAVRRSRSATRPWRLSARLVIAVLLESIVLVGTVQLSLGLGSYGLADTVPAPAPRPSYAAAPAHAVLPVSSTALPASPEAAPVPRPLEEPPPAP